MKRIAWFLLIVVLFCSSNLPAHVNSTSYSIISVENEVLSYTLMMYAADLWQFVWLDDDEDGMITQEEIEAKKDEIFEYVTSKISISNDGKNLTGKPMDIMAVKDAQDSSIIFGVEVSMRFTDLSPLEKISIACSIFEEIDYLHQSVGIIEAGGRTEKFFFFRDTRYEVVLSELNPWSSIRKNVLRPFVLWNSLILRAFFFLVILVPIIVRRDAVPTVLSFSAAALIASVCGMLGLITLTENFVSAVSALSLIYIAGENLFLKETGNRWIMTGFFGLIYGFQVSIHYIREYDVPEVTNPALVAFNVGLAVSIFLTGWLSLVFLQYLRDGKLANTYLVRVISVVILAAGLAGFAGVTLKFPIPGVALLF